MDNGTVSAIGSGGVPPYEYYIAGLSIFRSGNFTSLKPGEYTIAVRDANKTIASQKFFISHASTPPDPSFTKKDPSSCDKMDGVLNVNMSGGSPPFQYSLDDLKFQNSNVFTGLTHGVYHFYVKDANGCRTTFPTRVWLVAPNCDSLRVEANHPKCGNNGRISFLDPIPGKAPRKYSRDGINYQESPTFLNLAEGVQTIRVKDAFGVVRLFSMVLSYSCVMQLSLATVAAGCSNTGGSITATPNKGEGPYEYSINDGPFGTSNKFDFLKAGTYLVKVRDVKGLTVSMSTTLRNSCPTITATTIKGATCGDTNGEIEVNGSGGTSPYEYSIDGSPYQASNKFTGLDSGSYTIFIKDAAGGTNTTNVVISAQLIAKVSGTTTAASCQDNDGSITAVNASGQSPLVYSINSTNFNALPVFNNLASGDYKLMVKDGNGCMDSVDVIVPMENSLLLNLDSEVTICEGSIASLKVNSNASLFQWSSGPGITDKGMRDQNVGPLVTTRYTLTATTGKCTTSDTVMVIVKPAPNANAGNDQVICYGEDAKLEGSGGLIFNWTPSRNLTDIHSPNPTSVKPVSTLEYALTVTDASGCSSLQPDMVKITVTTPKIFAGNDTSILINQPFHLNAVDVNNTGFIQYNWQPPTGLSNPNIADPVATLDKNTTYRVTAKTASGCEASDNVYIQIYKSADIFVPNAFTPNGDGQNDYARPILRGIKELTSFTIYNRWGGVVYRFTPGSNGWDGRINGIPQSSAAFTWIAEGIDFYKTKLKRYGTIMIVR